MGFFGRMMGTDPESRIRKAKKFLDRHDFGEARFELLELDHPEAKVLLRKALDGLVELNFEEAAARSRMGDGEGAAEHIELAKSFGATPERIRDLRRKIREERQAEKIRIATETKKNEEPEGSDPLWALTPEDPRLRFALMLEAWPTELRDRLSVLGAPFASAALLLEDGNAEEAVNALTPFVPREVAVRLFRARAQIALGNLPAAASDLRTLGDEMGHLMVGKQHTGVTLVQVLAQLGRTEEALDLIEEESGKLDENDPVLLPLGGSKASLLERLGRFEEAEHICEDVMKKAPRDMGLYRMLARIRVALGNRMGAMQALEGGLVTCCSSPGKCGNQPFDVHAGRMLAQLYLEDRIEPARTKELLAELGKNVDKPSWQDRYLASLVVRNADDPTCRRMASALIAELPEGDARRAMVARQFTLTSPNLPA